MSARMVKRALQEQKPSAAAVAADDGTDSEDDRSQAQAAKMNMFDLLGSQARASSPYRFMDFAPLMNFFSGV